MLSRGRKNLLNCNKCSRPDIIPENFESYNIIRKYRATISKADYTIDLISIERAMEIENIDILARGITAEKIINWFTIINNKLWEKNK